MEQLTIDFEIIELPARAIGIEVPAWADQDITLRTIEAIAEGHCIGLEGALQQPAGMVLAMHGEIIAEYLCFHGEPTLDLSEGWSMALQKGLATAVELWATLAGVTHQVPQYNDVEDYIKLYARACESGDFEARDEVAHKFSNAWLRLKIDNSRLIINDIPMRDDADLFLQLIAICELKSIKLSTK